MDDDFVLVVSREEDDFDLESELVRLELFSLEELPEEEFFSDSLFLPDIDLKIRLMVEPDLWLLVDFEGLLELTLDGEGYSVFSLEILGSSTGLISRSFGESLVSDARGDELLFRVREEAACSFGVYGAAPSLRWRKTCFLSSFWIETFWAECTARGVFFESLIFPSFCIELWLRATLETFFALSCFL